MGGCTLGVNQRHLNAAALMGEDGTDSVQESGTVLGDDFQQGAGRRTFIVETRPRFDDECSPASTLLEVVTQDRPGLLHTISSILAHQSCSIEVALIDTEGATAHDAFYLTCGGIQLTREQPRATEGALTTELDDSLPSTW